MHFASPQSDFKSVWCSHAGHTKQPQYQIQQKLKWAAQDFLRRLYFGKNQNSRGSNRKWSKTKDRMLSGHIKEILILLLFFYRWICDHTWVRSSSWLRSSLGGLTLPWQSYIKKALLLAVLQYIKPSLDREGGLQKVFALFARRMSRWTKLKLQQRKNRGLLAKIQAFNSLFCFSFYVLLWNLLIRQSEWIPTDTFPVKGRLNLDWRVIYSLSREGLV